MEDLTAGRRGEGIRDHGLPLLMAGAGFGGKDFFNFYLLIGGERKDTQVDCYFICLVPKKVRRQRGN